MRFLKSAACTMAMAAGLFSASGFSLLGPINEDYQQPVIGYNVGGDIGAPKNIGEEYRWNTPVIYYAVDQSFTDYFGTNGINEIDGAFAFLNALTNTGFSALDINEFPLSSFRINPRAEELQLVSLKGQTLHLIIEELGLANPERWVWTLHERFTQPNESCPEMIYYVIMRNFDPFIYTPSAYINGILYTYQIVEACTGSNPLALAVPFPVDPTDPSETTVAGYGLGNYGAFPVALSRDDVGGLKYLYRTNNVNWESLSSDSQQFTPDRSQAQLLFSSNLWTFASQSLTNNAAALQALYPGLIITGTTNIFTNIWVTNLVAYFTNNPWMPVDSFPQLVFATNRVLTVQTRFIHNFANLYTAELTNGVPQLIQLQTVPTNRVRTRVELQTIVLTNSPWMPADWAFLDIDTQTYFTNVINGDFFILPTNACSVELLALQATLTTRVTNSLIGITNGVPTNPGGTNDSGGTNFLGQIFAQDLITTERNRVWLYYPIICDSTNTATLRQGVDRLQFVRSSYDSLIGRYFRPITNFYTSMEITNSMLVPRQVRRIVTSPDFLFRSQDLVDERQLPFGRRTDTASNFNTNNAIPGLAGPGNIEPDMTIIFNRVGPLFIHNYNENLPDRGLSQAEGFLDFIWGSFDGSTNEPVIYPTGSSAGDVESILLFQILSKDLPEATVGVPYSFQLEGTGGQLPYNWAPDVNSFPLPAGLSLSANGIISGIPEEEGDFSFSVTLTETGARTTTRTLTIHINP